MRVENVSLSSKPTIANKSTSGWPGLTRGEADPSTVHNTARNRCVFTLRILLRIHTKRENTELIVDTGGHIFENCNAFQKLVGLTIQFHVFTHQIHFFLFHVITV